MSSTFYSDWSVLLEVVMVCISGVSDRMYMYVEHVSFRFNNLPFKWSNYEILNWVRIDEFDDMQMA